jgi:hypothetical protein
LAGIDSWFNGIHASDKRGAAAHRILFPYREKPGGGIPGETFGVFAASFDAWLRSGVLIQGTSRVGAG